MKRAFDPALFKTLVITLIGFLFFYIIYHMLVFGDGNAERQAEHVQGIIENALVQCYALEGSYPAEVDYVSRYGVIFDNNNYVYYYEWYGGNIRPTVIVMEK